MRRSQDLLPVIRPSYDFHLFIVQLGGRYFTVLFVHRVDNDSLAVNVAPWSTPVGPTVPICRDPLEMFFHYNDIMGDECGRNQGGPWLPNPYGDKLSPRDQRLLGQGSQDALLSHRLMHLSKEV